MTQADGADRADTSSPLESAAPEAMGDGMSQEVGQEMSREAGQKLAAAPDSAPAEASRITRELPAIAIERAESAPATPAAQGDLDDDEVDEGATREAPAVSAPPRPQPQPQPHPQPQPQPQPLANEGGDPDATILRAAPHPPLSSLLSESAESALAGLDVWATGVEDGASPQVDDSQATPPTSRPRYNTLAGAFNRSRSAASDPAAPTSPSTRRGAGASDPVAPRAPQPSQPSQPAYASQPSQPSYPSYPSMGAPEPETPDGILDEVELDEDEWSVADQPTIQLSPEQLQALSGSPSGPLSDRRGPALPDVSDKAGRVGVPSEPQRDWRAGLPPRPRPPFPLEEGMPRPLAPGAPRLAAPDGRVIPDAPSRSQAGAQPDPRMRRFQELHKQRAAQEEGDLPAASPTVAAAVSQWWSDLRPVAQKALRYQREARASGTYPLPAYEPAVASRLGDAFGRLAASARDLSERAQQAAGPTIKRLHDQVEQAAQGLIQRFEGDSVRQQAPFLGPGRVAIFFRPGVTVGQAQRLLTASSARPMRLIPRKHGFLARVQQGREAEVCERLRQHPYVRDVVYLEYDQFGEPAGARR